MALKPASYFVYNN